MHSGQTTLRCFGRALCVGTIDAPPHFVFSCRVSPVWTWPKDGTRFCGLQVGECAQGSFKDVYLAVSYTDCDYILFNFCFKLPPDSSRMNQSACFVHRSTHWWDLGGVHVKYSANLLCVGLQRRHRSIIPAWCSSKICTKVFFYPLLKNRIICSRSIMIS